MAKKTKGTSKGKEAAEQVSSPALAEIELGKIELSKIDSNPWQPRVTAPTDEEIAELMNSIKAVGQKMPIRARPHPTKEGRYQRADGAMRSLVMAKLGMKKILTLVEPLTDRQMKILAIAANTFVKLRDSDKERAIYKLWESEFKSEEQSKFRKGRNDTFTGIREMERETGIDSAQIVRYLQGYETRELVGKKIEIKTAKGAPVDAETRKEVLEKIEEGEKPAEIAERLKLDTKTVEKARALKSVSNRDLAQLKEIAVKSPKAAEAIIGARAAKKIEATEIKEVLKAVEKSTPGEVEKTVDQIVKRESGVSVTQAIKEIEQGRESPEEKAKRLADEERRAEEEAAEREREQLRKSSRSREGLDAELLQSFVKYLNNVDAYFNEDKRRNIANIRNDAMRAQVIETILAIAAKIGKFAEQYRGK